MKLIIDNSGDGQTVFFLKDGRLWKKEAGDWTKPLLVRLEALLKKHRKKITDLSGVAVVVGAGRFTAERIAATVANTLAFALNIPVIALKKPDTAEADKRFKTARRAIYISAKYSGRAHIGGKN
jgi:tRNA A37 threonylcarbamoyladenosine modification protein TsaB